MGDARNAALTVLEKSRRSGAWSDAILGSAMDAERLQGRDRALTAAIAYGVIQNRMLLDHVISACSTMDLKRIEPKVLDILRVAAYQLLMMERIPDAAAVNTAVQQCKERGYARASGFVNAVLRKMSSEKPEFPTAQDAESLSLRWSHPIWLTKLYLELLGPSEATMLLEADNAPVPITLQINPGKTSADALIARMASEGLRCEKHPAVPDCVILESGAVQRSKPYLDGDFYVQDAAAKMAVIAAAPRSGQRILDVCAAPGGKTFAAAILSGGAEIIACDIHANKLKRIRESAERLGLDRIAFRAQDAREFVPEFAEAFDLVIADVPCSGLGVIRKKPDIRYKNPQEFAGLPEIQRAILQNVARYVKKGGTLLYSTCTIRPEENGDVVHGFLQERNDYTYEDFTLPDGSVSCSGMLQLWAQRNGTDGFFIAKMRRWK